MEPESVASISVLGFLGPYYVRELYEGRILRAAAPWVLASFVYVVVSVSLSDGTRDWIDELVFIGFVHSVSFLIMCVAMWVWKRLRPDR